MLISIHNMLRAQNYNIIIYLFIQREMTTFAFLSPSSPRHEQFIYKIAKLCLSYHPDSALTNPQRNQIPWFYFWCTMNISQIIMFLISILHTSVPYYPFLSGQSQRSFFNTCVVSAVFLLHDYRRHRADAKSLARVLSYLLSPVCQRLPELVS